MKRWATAAATALILASGAAANAQQSAGGMVSNSSAPVDVAADEQVVINSKCITIFNGNVEILQDRSRLRAKKVTIYSAKRPGTENACGAAQRMEAEGDVYLVSDKQQARGDNAVYTFDNSIAIVTGDVVLVQGKDVARGDRLTVNTKTNDARMESTAKGRTAPRRVRAVFYQDDKNGGDKSAATPATPGATPSRPAADR